MIPPTVHANCGTDAGYHRHHRRREQPCQWCRDAHAAAVRSRRNRQGLRDGRILVDASLFAAMYLETSVARQLDAEQALGRRAIDQLVAQFDQSTS